MNVTRFSTAGLSFLAAAILLAPTFASAAATSTVAHPPPPLPAGAKVGVVSDALLASTTASAPTHATGEAGAAPAKSSTAYYAIVLLCGIALLGIGFFLGRGTRA